MASISIESHLNALNKWDVYPGISTIYSGPARILAAAVQIIAGAALTIVSAAFGLLNSKNTWMHDCKINIKEIGHGVGNLIRGVVACCPFAGNLAIYVYEKSAIPADAGGNELLNNSAVSQGKWGVDLSGIHQSIAPQFYEKQSSTPLIRNLAEIADEIPTPKVVLQRDAEGYYTLTLSPHIFPGFVNMGTIRAREINVRSRDFILDTANGILPEGWVLR